MYEELNCFEEALKHFGTRVEIHHCYGNGKETIT